MQHTKPDTQANTGGGGALVVTAPPPTTHRTTAPACAVAVTVTQVVLFEANVMEGGGRTTEMAEAGSIVLSLICHVWRYAGFGV